MIIHVAAHPGFWPLRHNIKIQILLRPLRHSIKTQLHGVFECIVTLAAVDIGPQTTEMGNG